LIFFLFYATITLVTGTFAGMAYPFTSGVTTALFVAVILVGVWKFPTARLGGGGDWACVAFLACALVTAVASVCPYRALHLTAPFVAAAVLFYLVLDGTREDLAPRMAAVAAIAAVAGLVALFTGNALRVTVPFGLHHYAAGFMLLHLPITWKLAQPGSPRRWLWLAAAGVQVAAIVGTYSMAAEVILGLMVLWTLRHKPLLLVGALAILATIALLVPRTHNLLMRGEDPSLSTENRIRYLRTGIAMLKARPLGWGLGSVPLVAAPFRPQVPDVMPQGEVLPHMHNLPMHIAVETGLLGFLAAAWFLWRGRSLQIAPYLLFAMADYQLDIPSLLIALAAVAGLYATRGQPSSSWRVPRKLAQLAMLVVAALAPISTTCGWDDFLAGRYTVAAGKLPDLIPLSAAAGAAAVEAGQYREAIPYLEHDERLDGYFALAWFHHGRALLQLGDRDGAVAKFAQGMLTQPVTIFAENWDPEIYAQAQRRAVADLEALSGRLSRDERTQYRYRELHAFLANNPTPPKAEFRVPYSEITDANLPSSTSLLVFRRPQQPKFTSTIYVMLPRPDFYIPPGIGYLRLR
jgi:hypothetical protein